MISSFKTSMGWLWHRRLAHVGMKNLHKLLKGEHVLGLTNVTFKKDRPCAACQAGKQVGSAHHSKNVMTTSSPLELQIGRASCRERVLVLMQSSHFWCDESFPLVCLFDKLHKVYLFRIAHQLNLSRVLPLEACEGSSSLHVLSGDATASPCQSQQLSMHLDSLFFCKIN